MARNCESIELDGKKSRIRGAQAKKTEERLSITKVLGNSYYFVVKSPLLCLLRSHKATELPSQMTPMIGIREGRGSLNLKNLVILLNVLDVD